MDKITPSDLAQAKKLGVKATPELMPLKEKMLTAHQSPMKAKMPVGKMMHHSKIK